MLIEPYLSNSKLEKEWNRSTRTPTRSTQTPNSDPHLFNQISRWKKEEERSFHACALKPASIQSNKSVVEGGGNRSLPLGCVYSTIEKMHTILLYTTLPTNIEDACFSCSCQGREGRRPNQTSHAQSNRRSRASICLPRNRSP